MPCSSCKSGDVAGHCQYFGNSCGDYCEAHSVVCRGCGQRFCHPHLGDHLNNSLACQEYYQPEAPTMKSRPSGSGMSQRAFEKSERETKLDDEESTTASSSTSGGGGNNNNTPSSSSSSSSSAFSGATAVVAKKKEEPESIHPPPQYTCVAPWDCTIRIFGRSLRGQAKFRGGKGWLRGGIYHDISWSAAETEPLIASRFEGSTKQSEKTVVTWKEFQKVCTANLAYEMSGCICLGASVFVLPNKEAKSPLFDRLLLRAMELMKKQGVLATVSLIPAEWRDVSIVNQCGNLLSLILRKTHYDAVLQVAMDFKIVGHTQGGGVFGADAVIPDLLTLSLEAIVSGYLKADGEVQQLWLDLAAVWCRVCELLIAWRSASIGCRSAYLRLEAIDEAVHELCQGFSVSTEPRKTVNFLAAAAQAVRRWATLCRRNLNVALRQAIYGLNPSGAGGRWDIEKEFCLCPTDNPYEFGEIGDTAQSFVEAHTALALMGLHPQRFRARKVRRYMVFAGPSKEEVQRFVKFDATISASNLEENFAKELTTCCRVSNLWKKVVQCVAADEEDSRLRRRDVRGFSSPTLRAMEAFLNSIDVKYHAPLKDIFKVAGHPGFKDAEYWDSDGLPWDQKTMFDPFMITGLSFEGAVNSFVTTVCDQAADAHNGEIAFPNGDACRRMGIVFEVTLAGPRVYECIWARIYERFDIGDLPYLDDRNRPLILEVISPTLTTMLTRNCALPEKGLPGILSDFEQRNGGQLTITFDTVQKYCNRHCDIVDLSAYCVQKFSASWEWHKDYQDQFAILGMYCEIAVRYRNLEEGEASGRILINVVEKVLIFCPLHYIPYMVPNLQRTGGAVRPYLYTVTFPSDQERDEFFDKL